MVGRKWLLPNEPWFLGSVCRGCVSRKPFEVGGASLPQLLPTEHIALASQNIVLVTQP